MGEQWTSIRVYGATTTEVCALVIGELAKTCRLAVEPQGIFVTTPSERHLVIHSIIEIAPRCTELYASGVLSEVLELAPLHWVVRCETMDLNNDLCPSSYTVNAYGQRVFAHHGDGDSRELAARVIALAGLREQLGDAATVLDVREARRSGVSDVSQDLEDAPF